MYTDMKAIRNYPHLCVEYLAGIYGNEIELNSNYILNRDCLGVNGIKSKFKFHGMGVSPLTTLHFNASQIAAVHRTVKY